MTVSPANDRVVFISKFNRGMAIVVWALDAFVLVGYIWVHAGLRDPLVLAPVALVALLARVALWRPHVAVDDGGTELRNVFRTVRVPWGALIHVDTKYALTLFTPGHRYSAWAAPAPGRTGAAMASRVQNKRPQIAPMAADGTMRPGDLIGSESGQAAYLVRDRWAELRERGLIEPGLAESTPVVIRVHWWLDAALLVLAVGTVLLFVL